MGSLTHRPHQIQCPKCESSQREPHEIGQQIPRITAPTGKNKPLCPLQNQGQKHPTTDDPPPSLTARQASVTSLSQGNERRQSEHTEQYHVQQDVQPPVHPPIVCTQLATRHGMEGHNGQPHPECGLEPTPAALSAGLSRLPRHMPRPTSNGPDPAFHRA